MHLDTIEIDRDEAKARLAEYQKSLRHDRNMEDEAIASAYRAAARGLPVIRLSEVMAAGGWFSTGLPKLAVVRADAGRCVVDVRSSWRGDPMRELLFQADERSRNLGALVGRYTVRVTVPAPERESRWTGTTIVPPIPPRFRPRKPWRFHVLWEVEKWQLVAPKDPALIKHIGGDLWSVHAVWDLTELERAVITGTR